jgi:hypothetical protein
MSLQQNVAESNPQHLNNPILFNANEYEKASTSIELSLFDILGRKTKTPIAAGNVLIFGNNPSHVQEVALKIHKDFARAGCIARLVKASDFLANYSNQIDDRNSLYIITCNDMSFPLELLKQAIDLTKTQIILKIPNIDWQTIRFDKMKRNAKIIDLLSTFEINDTAHRCLIGSLYDKEFCIFNGRSLLKRMMD